MRYVLVLIFFILTTSVTANNVNNDVNRKIKKGDGWEKHSVLLKKKFATIAFHRNQMILIGMGGGGCMGFNKVCLDFHLYKKMKVDEVRELYLENVENLLDMLNTSERLKPYMLNYPFNVDNLDFTIVFKDIDREYCKDGNVAMVYNQKGRIVYLVWDPVKRGIEPYYSEGYEEAKQKVNLANLPSYKRK